MKVTFVNPNYENSVMSVIEKAMPPIDLVNCATILQKKGFHVGVVDATIDRRDARDIASEVSGSDVVAVTTFVLTNWSNPPLEIPQYYALLSELKKCAPRPFIIAMGPHSLFNAEGLARASDLVVIGQPEPFFERLTPAMKTEEYVGIDGTAFMKQGRFVRRGGPQMYDLKRLPQPNLKLIPYSRYRYATFNGPVAVVETGRGCPEDCAFCFRGMTDYTFSSKMSKQVVNELSYIYHQLGINRVLFADLSIDAATGVFRAWMEEIIRQDIKIRWACNIRISAFEDAKLVRLMSEAGCELVCVGIEGATQKAFDDLKKNRNKTEVIQKIKILKEHSIKILGYFLLGSAYDETEEDTHKTIGFSKTLGLDYAVFYIATPFPTTRFYNHVKHHPLDYSSERIPLCYNKHFTRERLVRLRKEAYLRFYLRPEDIVSHLGQLRHPEDYLRNLRLFLNVIRR